MGNYYKLDIGRRFAVAYAPYKSVNIIFDVLFFVFRAAVENKIVRSVHKRTRIKQTPPAASRLNDFAARSSVLNS